ncbi:hypothetical protein [Tritonibacter mobilis]|uniref:hypothetical protein n=1 Tax=Tritonibacter mobilis TaxID=379347 RepID=UPI0013A59DC8|nr:hypothetical protein [Tritonibacter mobilis]
MDQIIRICMDTSEHLFQPYGVNTADQPDVMGLTAFPPNAAIVAGIGGERSI